MTNNPYFHDVLSIYAMNIFLRYDATSFLHKINFELLIEKTNPEAGDSKSHLPRSRKFTNAIPILILH
jgi:hypothetical protein